MTPDDFCKWLKGFMDAIPKEPTHEQWMQMEDKLEEVELSGRRPTMPDIVYRGSPLIGQADPQQPLTVTSDSKGVAR